MSMSRDRHYDPHQPIERGFNGKGECMTETVLFVGGVVNGKIIDLNSPKDRIEVPVLIKGEFGRQSYYRQSISIYLADGESPDNLIPLLIEGYRKAK